MSGRASVPLIRPDWPAPAWVGACSTTRQGGVSLLPWDSLNLGTHVGDVLGAVAQNRQVLATELGLESDHFGWLEQVHGTDVAELPLVSPTPRADASTAVVPGQVCAVLTADCLPVLFCDCAGTRVAAAHAGWRGLLDGVLENTVARFESPRLVMAWLGPAIGPGAFEVGPEVRDAFVDKHPHAADCFRKGDRDRYLADIYGLARACLLAQGVSAVYGGGCCTWTEAAAFYSYRRDGRTGRQASLIWLAPREV